MTEQVQNPVQQLLADCRAEREQTAKELQEIDILTQQSTTEVERLAQESTTPVRRWENGLELPVALIVLPLFAFLNAGIPISGQDLLVDAPRLS